MGGPSFNLRHLRAFAKTFELGTLLAASRAVHITQPALTQGLSRLEDQIGQKLFERERDGMKPTAAAALLYPRVMRALGFIRSNRVSQAQLRAFTALARTGSYAEASADTGLARASLHRSVSDLEIAIHQTLVERRGRAVELTRAGQAIARRFNLALSELSAAADELQSLNGEARGRVSIGAMPLCRARVLPAAIVDFRSRFPNAHLKVAEGSHVELIDPLRDGELDFLIGALRDPPPGPDLVQAPLFEDKPVVLARKDHPLPAGNRSLELSALAEFDWCIPGRGVPLRESWEAMFADAGHAAPRVRIECGSVIAIRQILIGTDCLTILSPDQVAVELEAGWLKIVAAAPSSLVRRIGVTYREGWRPTALQQNFLDTLRAVCAGAPEFV
jgi:DNA-binding transcriptional LysR family regulator